MQPTAQVVASIYNATASANIDFGFAAATSGSSNIAFLDPANTTTTSSGTTSYLDPSGTYTVPSGYQAMIATGDFSYQMNHQAGGTAMDLVANAGLDTITSAVSGDTVQAGTGFLVDVQSSGALTFLGGANASSVFGGAGTTTYYGSAGNDLVLGGSGGRSALYAGSGNDTVIGGGAGSVFGGSGSDILMGGASDLLVAGSGNTTAGERHERQPLSRRRRGHRVRRVGGAASTGGTGTGVAIMGAGNETFAAGTGNATVFSGSGTLAMTLGAGNDAVILGTAGNADFAATAGSFTGNAVVFGFSSADQLAFSGYGSGQVTQTVYNGSTVIHAQNAAITLIGYTGQVTPA